MKGLSFVLIIMLTQSVIAQTKPSPFSEASRAISSLENESKVFDSLKRVYNKRVTLNFTYGQRFLLDSDISSLRDTITNADFTSRRSLWGLGSSYFIKDHWSVGIELNFTILPKEQEIDFSTFSGSGNGGVAISIGLSSKYYFKKTELLRPYVGVVIGSTTLRALGGEGSLSGGQTTTELTSRLRSAQIQAGFGYRVSPGLILDYNLGFTRTSKTELIGGVTSYGGIMTSLTFQFVLNHKNDQ